MPPLVGQLVINVIILIYLIKVFWGILLLLVSYLITPSNFPIIRRPLWYYLRIEEEVGSNMPYILLGVEGILTFISPCLLPMLPIYLAYISGQVEQVGAKSQGRRPFLIQAILFVLGFTLVFIVMSLFVTTLGRFVLMNRTLIHQIAGGFMMLIGVDYFLGNPLMNRIQLGSQKTFNHSSAFILGMVFSISWTPCVGTFLASALSYAATSTSYLESVGLLLSYSLGLGIPFILSALFIEEMLVVVHWIKQHYEVIRKVSGIFLIAFGLFTMTGWLESLLVYLS